MGACEKKKLLLGTEPQRKCYCAAPNGAENADRKGFPMAPRGHPRKDKKRTEAGDKTDKT